MTTEEILQSLCYYDKRNPDCTADDEDIKDYKAQLLRVSKKLGYNKTCSCDNCFYGRTKLAEELLKVIATTNVALVPKEETFYRVFDHQRGIYFATGYNAESMEQLISDFRSYMQEEDDENNRTWSQIVDSLQDITLEKSDKPFEQLD
jgi:hypothetical protein